MPNDVRDSGKRRNSGSYGGSRNEPFPANKRGKYNPRHASNLQNLPSGTPTHLEQFGLSPQELENLTTDLTDMLRHHRFLPIQDIKRRYWDFFGTEMPPSWSTMFSRMLETGSTASDVAAYLDRIWHDHFEVHGFLHSKTADSWSTEDRRTICFSLPMPHLREFNMDHLHTLVGPGEINVGVLARMASYVEKGDDQKIKKTAVGLMIKLLDDAHHKCCQLDHHREQLVAFNWSARREVPKLNNQDVGLPQLAPRAPDVSCFEMIQQPLELIVEEEEQLIRLMQVRYPC